MTHEVTCRNCGRVLHIAEEDARPSLTCPRCLALVVDPRALVRTDLPAAPRHKGALDDEVRRDSRGGTIVAAVLGAIVLVGVIVFLTSGGPQLVSASKDGPVVFGIGILVLGAIAAGTIVVVSTSKNKIVTALTGVVGGVFIGAGVVVLAIVLVCMGMLQTCANFNK